VARGPLGCSLCLSPSRRGLRHRARSLYRFALPMSHALDLRKPRIPQCGTVCAGGLVLPSRPIPKLHANDSWRSKASSQTQRVCASPVCACTLIFVSDPPVVECCSGCRREESAALLGGEQGSGRKKVWPSYPDQGKRVRWLEFGERGRSALRPDPEGSRACAVDRPPALFSQAEENLRPLEPAFSSSTGGAYSGSGSRKHSLS
jgi:hypothetical protein